MKEPCPDFLERLSAYADGELDAARARRVEEHVASCDACRETLRAWRDADAALAGTDVARSDVEWERLARRVESAIDAEAAGGAIAAQPAAARATAGTSRRPHWLWSAGSGALVAAALVLLFWPWVSNQTRETPPSLPRGHEAARGIEAQSGSDAATPPRAELKTEMPQADRDVRRVAVPPDLGGSLATGQSKPAAGSEAPESAPAATETLAKESIPAKENAAGTFADAAPPVARSEERIEPSGETFAEVLIRRTESALAVPAAKDEDVAFERGGRTKSLARPAEPESRAAARDVASSPPATPLEDLRRLAAEWRVIVADPDAPIDRNEALGYLVLVSAELVEADPDAECPAALAAVKAWRDRRITAADVAGAAARIDAACASR